MTAPSTIAPGQTDTASGDVGTAITLGASSTLDIAANTEASLFGGIVTAGSAAIVLGADSTLFAPAATPAGVTLVFAGAGSELILAASTLADFAANLASLPTTTWIDVAGCQITAVTTATLAAGSYGLVLASAQGVLGTIDVGSAPPATILAIPDGFDGSLLLSGPALPPPGAAVAGSSAPAATFAFTGGTGGTSWSNVASWRSAGGSVTRAPGPQDTVTIAGGSLGLTILAGTGHCAVLGVSGLVALTGPFSATTLTVGLAASDALILTAGTNMAVTNASLRSGVLSIQAATLSVAGTLTVAGFLDGNSASTITAATLQLSQGTLRLSNDTGLLVGGTDSQTPGTLTIAHDGRVSGTGTIDAPITLLGMFEVTSGTLSVFGGVTGTGTIALDSGATLFATGGLGAATIAFLGSRTTLETVGTVSGTLVSGFGLGDELEIAGAAAGSVTWTPVGTGGTLDLGVYGAIAIGLAPGLDPQRVSFSETADGFGGVSITVLPCFTAATHLRTPTGWIMAGAVTPRTWLCTAGGAARRAVWIGRTTIEGWRRSGEPHLDPVVFPAGALGPGQPLADLRLSPLHGLVMATAVGPRIVPAVALCDGHHITRDRAISRLEYVHIALEQHDAVLAEGLPCESFLPHGPDPRGQFTLSAGHRPNTTLPLAARLDHGPLLHDLRRRFGLSDGHRPASLSHATIDTATLSGRYSVMEGWVREADRVELLIDGHSAWKGRRDVWRADLEAAGINDGMAAFVATIPCPTPGAKLSLRPTP